MPHPRKTTQTLKSKQTKTSRQTKKRTISRWTAADLSTLRKLTGRRTAAVIAQQLGRTESAVRQKAGALGHSLRMR